MSAHGHSFLPDSHAGWRAALASQSPRESDLSTENPKSLVNCSIDDKYIIDHFLGDIGGYSKPFRGRVIRNQEVVFIKVFDNKPCYQERELMEVERILEFNLEHENLVEIKATFKNAVARNAAGAEIRVSGVVMEYCAGGDLFSLVMHTKQGIRCFDERMARHLMHKILKGVSVLHNHSVYHRDLKPENILFNHNFDVKLADFGFNIYAPPTKEGLAVAKSTHTPTGHRQWRVGTVEYTAPELLIDPDDMKYDASKVDVWSLGMILLVMLGADKFGILKLPGQAPCVRMPFSRYDHAWDWDIYNNCNYPPPYNLPRSVPSLLYLLEDPGERFTGTLRNSEDVPKNETFWKQFPNLHLSDSVKDLLNRMLCKSSEKRIVLSEIINHDWMLEHDLPSAEAIREELLQRSKTSFEAGIPQATYLPRQKQELGSSIHAVHQEQRYGGSQGLVFPHDKTMQEGTLLVSCGSAFGVSAATIFSGLSQFLFSHGLVESDKEYDSLRLTACSITEKKELIPQFHLKVFVAGGNSKSKEIPKDGDPVGDVMVFLESRKGADRFPYWKGKIRTWCEVTGVHVTEGDSAKPLKKRSHEEMQGAGEKLESVPKKEKQEKLTTFSGMNWLQDLVTFADYWPPCCNDEKLLSQRLWVVLLESHPGRDHCGKNDFVYFFVSYAKIPTTQVVSAWCLVMGADSDQVHMRLEEFTKAHYIILRSCEGRNIGSNHMFPVRNYNDTVRIERPIESPDFGSKSNPLSYAIFTYLFRPLLEGARKPGFMDLPEEWRGTRVVYKKVTPILVLCKTERSPFDPTRSFDYNVDYNQPADPNEDKFQLCNFCSPPDDKTGSMCYPKREDDFIDCYMRPKMDLVVTDDMLEGSATVLQRECMKAFHDDKVVGARMHRIDWEAVRKQLIETKLKTGSRGGWHIALPKGYVVGYQFSAGLLKSVLAQVKIEFRPGVEVYYMASNKRSCLINDDDYLVSDVHIESNHTGQYPNSRYHPGWSWKYNTKTYNMQTLITRTIPMHTFEQTYAKMANLI